MKEMPENSPSYLNRLENNWERHVLDLYKSIHTQAIQ